MSYVIYSIYNNDDSFEPHPAKKFVTEIGFIKYILDNLAYLNAKLLFDGPHAVINDYAVSLSSTNAKKGRYVKELLNIGKDRIGQIHVNRYRDGYHDAHQLLKKNDIVSDEILEYAAQAWVENPETATIIVPEVETNKPPMEHVYACIDQTELINEKFIKLGVV